jgi:hypothetical protein
MTEHRARPADIVDAQVKACSSRDLDAFVACFHDDVIVTGHDGTVQVQGAGELRARYGALFAGSEVTAEVVDRLVTGDWIVNQERLWRNGELVSEALVAYQIDRARIRRIVNFS